LQAFLSDLRGIMLIQLENMLQFFEIFKNNINSCWLVIVKLKHEFLINQP